MNTKDLRNNPPQPIVVLPYYYEWDLEPLSQLTELLEAPSSKVIFVGNAINGYTIN